MPSQLRLWLTHHPRWYRLAQIVRFSFTLGPWRPLIIRYLQHVQKNPTLSAVSEATMFPSLDVDSVVASLHRVGWAPGLRVPDDCVDDVLKYSDGSPETILLDTHYKSPAIRRLAFDPRLLSVARRYIGTEPLFVGTALWRSRISPASSSANGARTFGQTFHFDVADFRSLTVFIYLTDVHDADAGAHVLIEGTHNTKSVREILTPWMTDTVAQAKYEGRIRTITGPKGTGFFEEQTIIHKQAIPLKPRVALLLTYSLRRRRAR